MKRTSTISRTTGETSIDLTLDLDGTGQGTIETPVPFLSHMLDLFRRHGLMDLTVQAKGDVEVDDHHTTEDVGIVLGQAIREAVGDKKGIKRYGQAWVPMDDALVHAVVDFSNRPHLEFRVNLPSQKVGTFDTELVYEFMWKLAIEARINLHINVPYGHNTHHIIEAVFKAVARAIDDATQIDPRVTGVPSTKGLL